MVLRKICVVGLSAVVISTVFTSSAGADPSPKVAKASKKADTPAAKPKQRSTSRLFVDGVKPILREVFVVPAAEKNWLAYQAKLKKRKLISLDLIEVEKFGEPVRLNKPTPCTLVNRYELAGYQEVFGGTIMPSVAGEVVIEPVRFALNSKGEVVCIAFTPAETGKVTVNIGCVGGGAYNPVTTLFVVPKGTVVVPGLVEVSAKQVTIEQRGPDGGCYMP